MAMNNTFVDDGGTSGAAYDMTSGFNPQAAKNLLVHNIYPEIIKKAQEALSVDDEDYKRLRASLRDNWKGKAREAFETKLETNMKALSDQLLKEYYSLYNRFYEMETNYNNFDNLQSKDI